MRNDQTILQQDADVQQKYSENRKGMPAHLFPSLRLLFQKQADPEPGTIPHPVKLAYGIEQPDHQLSLRLKHQIYAGRKHGQDGQHIPVFPFPPGDPKQDQQIQQEDSRGDSDSECRIADVVQILWVDQTCRKPDKYDVMQFH